ncbi:MAG: Tellurite resistance protein TerB [Candidatus Pelagibacter sp.]|nr:Tellurite resistance protein TerB [Candidatus Pelagibacter sp.]|tara:strand:- start:1120 stop:1548 length:429 start_codon:yes stop_codon:yes gene_type:complete
MFNIFKNKAENKEANGDINSFTEIACLLIHASKIDEDYTEKEKRIIIQTLESLGAKQNEINNIILNAENIEKDSNQILDFTRRLKNEEKEVKLSLIEALWKIIFSNDLKDMYEANLMRRLTGLLYLDPKDVGDIKKKVIDSK